MHAPSERSNFTSDRDSRTPFHFWQKGLRPIRIDGDTRARAPYPPSVATRRSRSSVGRCRAQLEGKGHGPRGYMRTLLARRHGGGTGLQSHSCPYGKNKATLEGDCVQKHSRSRLLSRANLRATIFVATIRIPRAYEYVCFLEKNASVDRKSQACSRTRVRIHSSHQ